VAQGGLGTERNAATAGDGNPGEEAGHENQGALRMKGIEGRIEAVQKNGGGQPAPAEMLAQSLFPVFNNLRLPGGKIDFQNPIGNSSHGEIPSKEMNHREHRDHRGEKNHIQKPNINYYHIIL
jgi:hypothetical protein